MRADIHNGQEHQRSIHGPDTEAQDQSPSSLTSGLQHTAGPYRWVIRDASPALDGGTAREADGSGLARGFFTFAGLVGAAMCSAY
jgi:hypothetical protein